MDNKPQFLYSRIRPTRDATGNNFNGELSFEFGAASDRRIDLQNSTIEMKCTITHNWLLGAIAAHNDLAGDFESISQNPMASLIKSGVLYINDVPVSRVHQYSIESTLLKMTLQNADENQNDGSPFEPYEAAKESIIIRESFVGRAEDLTISKEKRLNKTAIDLPKTKTATSLTFHFSAPLSPFFIQKELGDDLYQSKLRLSLQVNPEHKSDLLLFAAADAGVGVNISDIFLNIPTYLSVSGPPIGLKYSTTFFEAQSSIRINNTESFQITMPSPSVKYFMVAMNSNTSSQTTDVNNYDVGLKTGNEITSLYIDYAGRTYPNPQYDFGAGKRDYRRAYNDYVIFTEANAMGVATPMTFKQWIKTPVFVFITNPQPGNQSNILEVYVNGGDPNGSVLVSGWYEKQLNIEYGESGEIISTNVSVLNE